MRFGLAVTALAAFSVLAGAANAQTTTTTKKRVIARNADRTVVVSRDESGRTRTRIIVQKRSFLDPGTQTFPGEVRYNDSIQAVQTDPLTTQRNTAFDRSYQLPSRFELPFPNSSYEPLR
jgi:hypothetical protein